MIRFAPSFAALPLAGLLLASCQTEPGETSPLPGGGSSDVWAGIGADEALHVLGTEPFWGGEAKGGSLSWETPENPAGQTIAVTRFAGRGGLGLSGTLGGAPFELAASEAECSDGMSDRTYPFTVTVQANGQTLRGCGWSDARRFIGSEAP
ncbi:MAG: hypothetical protein B7Z33_14035 [Sphingomonadales bacterium 12-68-11]|nr:MAG: hypothetical protein B7Z33_14035 [Sphingomonadales bacterium 12-68-11]OYX16816.1 MAG: hypothetical protein B7Z07_01900 [Sphingomonadales bacterium 32-67-7]